MNKDLIKEADVLLQSIDRGVINVNALRSFLERLKKDSNIKRTVRMKDRVGFYVNTLTTKPKKAV